MTRRLLRAAWRSIRSSTWKGWVHAANEECLDCGGGVVVNRHVLTGINAIAGEWGHNSLPLPTPEDLPLPECFCGKRGCNELYISGTGLALYLCQEIAHRHGGEMGVSSKLREGSQFTLRLPADGNAS